MASYKNFEELPVWNAAIDLGVKIFKLTDQDSFKYKGDLVNQVRRAGLSVSNNIAEGFERGTTQELITFLYIARGSAGEVRSILRFAVRLGLMAHACDELIEESASISKQIRSWLDALQNTDIKGTRYLTDDSKARYEARKSQDAFLAQMADFKTRMDEGLKEGTWGKQQAAEPPAESQISKSWNIPTPKRSCRKSCQKVTSPFVRNAAARRKSRRTIFGHRTFSSSSRTNC